MTFIMALRQNISGGRDIDLEHAHEKDDVEAVWGSIGAVAHFAFHLGVIQVEVDELRKNKL